MLPIHPRTFLPRAIGLLLFVCCLQAQLHAQSNRVTDSIFAVIHAMPDDTAKVRYINNVYDNVLWQYNLPESYNQLKLAVRICKQYKNDTLLYRTYNTMAGFCVRANANDYALQHRKLALEIAERWKDSVKIGTCWGGMAMSYSNLGDYDLAITYFKKALPLIAKSGNIEKTGRFHTFLAWAYQGAGQTDSAIYYCEMGLAERRQAGYVDGMVASTNTLLTLYFEQKNFKRMNELIDQLVYALDTAKGGNSREGFALWYGAMHEERGNYDSAFWYYNLYAQNAERARAAADMKTAYYKLAHLLPKMGRTTEAYGYLKEHHRLNDSLAAWEARNKQERMREIYDIESKNAEIERLQAESLQQQIENREKDKQRLWLLGVLAVTTALVFVALFAYRQKRRSAMELGQQKAIIEEKNHDITDSIQYAKRIQQAILPSIDQIKAVLPDSFVFFAPKDIVSGDFFWFSETSRAYYLAVVDCTGHGVPGAMMSMIGHNFLGQIVNELDIDQPAHILDALHRKVVFALNKDSARAMRDGMDVALLRIDKKTKQVDYSGAVRPVYIVANGTLTELKGDISSIGGIKDATEHAFTQHRIDAPPGSCIYLFSDGYADQFGGPNGKKFKYKQLRDLLIRNAAAPMEEQRTELERIFVAWKSKLEQVDDVCVIGLRV